MSALGQQQRDPPIPMDDRNGRNRRTTDRQPHELEPPLCGISGPSEPGTKR
jgi:hypothetical protein